MKGQNLKILIETVINTNLKSQNILVAVEIIENPVVVETSLAQVLLVIRKTRIVRKTEGKGKRNTVK